MLRRTVSPGHRDPLTFYLRVKRMNNRTLNILANTAVNGGDYTLCCSSTLATVDTNDWDTRVLLVGDHKQLSPLSLPTRKRRILSTPTDYVRTGSMRSDSTRCQ